jgi:hypothetical protein
MTFEEFREEAKKGLGGVADSKVKRGIYNIILNRKCRPKEVIQTLVYLGMLDIDNINLIQEEKTPVVDLVEVDEVEVVNGKVKEEEVVEAPAEEKIVAKAVDSAPCVKDSVDDVINDTLPTIGDEVPKIENPPKQTILATAPVEKKEVKDYKIEEMGEAHVAAEIPSEPVKEDEHEPAMVVHDVINDTATPVDSASVGSFKQIDENMQKADMTGWFEGEVSEPERLYMLKEYNIDYNSLNPTALAEIRAKQKEFESSLSV